MPTPDETAARHTLKTFVVAMSIDGHGHWGRGTTVEEAHSQLPRCGCDHGNVEFFLCTGPDGDPPYVDDLGRLYSHSEPIDLPAPTMPRDPDELDVSGTPIQHVAVRAYRAFFAETPAERWERQTAPHRTAVPPWALALLDASESLPIRPNERENAKDDFRIAFRNALHALDRGEPDICDTYVCRRREWYSS